MIERRKHFRKYIIFEADLTSNGRSYKGVTKNISENGAYFEIHPTKNINDFIPQANLEIALHTPSGDNVNISCEVVWLYSKKFSPDGLKQNSVGVEIAPSKKLNDFLKTL
jgi:hypothetical protein